MGVKATTYYTVGIITGTHGIKGEVKVLSRTDFESERFRAGSRLHLRQAGELPVRDVEIQSARPHKQFWLVTFQGLATVEAVSSWRGMELCVEQSELAPLPEGTYYVHELVGLRVVSDEGQEIGTLTEVLTPGANDVYVVRPNESGHKRRRDVLVPAIPDCVKGVDLKRGVMTIHLMPGLLEEDDANNDPGRQNRNLNASDEPTP